MHAAIRSRQSKKNSSGSRLITGSVAGSKRQSLLLKSSLWNSVKARSKFTLKNKIADALIIRMRFEESFRN